MKKEPNYRALWHIIHSTGPAHLRLIPSSVQETGRAWHASTAPWPWMAATSPPSAYKVASLKP